MKSLPKSIDRSFQNMKNEVVETDVPKSGLNLSYRNHLGGLVLGRLYPQSVQHLMPSDKISGNNEASITFEQLATPVVDDMDVCVHNFLVTLRSIDNRWEKFMTPTKLNNMNTGVSVPVFDLKNIYGNVLLFISNGVIGNINKQTISGVDHYKFTFSYSNFIQSLSNLWDYVYHTDALIDLYEQIKSILGSTLVLNFDSEDSDSIDKFFNICTCVFDFFCGKRSLLDYLGYAFVSHSDLKVFYNVLLTTLPSYVGSPLLEWLINDAPASSSSSCFIYGYNSDDDAYDFAHLPSIIQNEYSLRAYYAIWFEYYRNYDLEPRSNTLPEYREFGQSSIFGNLLTNPIVHYNPNTLHFLIPRIRSWQQDAFTTAGIDDISRHVFAPILSTTPTFSTMSPSVGADNVIASNDLQPSNILDNSLVKQQINWRDPSTGVITSVDIPLPARVVSLIQTPSTLHSPAYSLELFSLRKAQMLENYLKRIYYGGDEYRDRMLHLYGARIEDYRINRPQWLSSSIDSVDPKQEVANTGVKPGDTTGFSIGERLATATAKQNGNDGFTEFCPEFGIYISLLSIMPHATYDPYLLQNLQTTYSDFPIPQFANQMEDVISTKEISRSVQNKAFGYAPYGHAYRYRVDEVHGDYHDDKFDYVFLRFFNDACIPNLSWSFIHCRPKLPMFVNSVLLDGQAYGTFKHNFYVERCLPSPVETI